MNKHPIFSKKSKQSILKKHIKKADITADTTNIFGVLMSFITGIFDAFPHLNRLTQSCLQALNCIPIVAAIIGFVPLIFRHIKAWIQRKSTAKKVQTSIALGIAIGSVIAAAISVFVVGLAVTFAAVGVCLTAASYVNDCVIPYVRSRKKEKRKELIIGAVNLVGAILVCIPTPVTIVIGISLLIMMAVIGVGVKYHEPCVTKKEKTRLPLSTAQIFAKTPIQKNKINFDSLHNETYENSNTNVARVKEQSVVHTESVTRARRFAP